jgi:hypothetical protein
MPCLADIAAQYWNLTIVGFIVGCNFHRLSVALHSASAPPFAGAWKIDKLLGGNAFEAFSDGRLTIRWGRSGGRRFRET